MENSVGRRRREAGLSQERLAQLSGVSRQTINAIERGRYDPRLGLAFRLAAVLACRVDEVFTPSD